MRRMHQRLAHLFLDIWYEMRQEKNAIELDAPTPMHGEVWRGVMFGEFRDNRHESAGKGLRVREEVDQTNRRQDARDRQAGVRPIRHVVPGAVAVGKMRTREGDDVWSPGHALNLRSRGRFVRAAL